MYLTVNKLAAEYNLSRETINRILARTNTSPDGMLSRWPAYSKELFEEAREKYYAQHASDITDDEEDGDTESSVDTRTKLANLRIKEANAEEKELFVAERKNTLVSRQKAENFLYFVVRMFVEKIRDLTRNLDNDELYNVYVEDAYAEIEAYIAENGFDYMIPEESQEKVKEILEHDSHAPESEYSI